jgi:HD-like signal output (HDOD) protein
MSDKSPSSLEEWLIYLKDKKFPVGSDNLTKLQNQLKSPQGAIDGLQHSILAEPFIGFMSISVANQIAKNNNNQIKTPTHAVSMVGIDGLEKITKQLYPCQFSNNNRAHCEFLRQVQISYEAASIAKFWSIEKRHANNEVIFWITFFRDAVKWLLWFYCYETMHKLTQNLKQGMKPKEAEEAIFGCRIDQLTVKLFQYWEIPSIIIDSFKTENTPTGRELKALADLTRDPENVPVDPDDRRLNFLANHSLLFAVCASKTAHIANQLGWDSKGLENYYKVISAALHCKQAKSIRAAHAACVESAKLFPSPYKVPLAKFLLSPDLYQKAKKPVKSQKETPLSALQKLAKSDQTTDKECLIMSIKVIKKLIAPASQILILNFDNEQNKLKVSLQYGFDLARLKQTKWDHTNKVFEKLLKKPSAVLFDEKKLNQIIRYLPNTLTPELTENQNLILTSFKSGPSNWKVIWIGSNTSFSENDFINTKRISSILSKRF